MQIFISDALNSYALTAVQQSLSDEALFVDGAQTAGRLAKTVKANRQGNRDALEIKGASRTIEKALKANDIFRAAAIPKFFARILINRYGPGMHYGPHTDEPIIDEIRTDLSFTLFLTSPESYEGGELVLCKASGDETIKLPAGSVVLYPSTTVHYVEPVRSGIRLAAVGWLQSRVRSAEHREILFDLKTGLACLPEAPENLEARQLFIKTYGNLLRLWAD